jgi:hypothetical protein
MLLGRSDWLKPFWKPAAPIYRRLSKSFYSLEKGFQNNYLMLAKFFERNFYNLEKFFNKYNLSEMSYP